MNRHLLITLLLAPFVLALMLGETVCDWVVELCEQIEREWNDTL
jgi:hypothetical protein